MPKLRLLAPAVTAVARQPVRLPPKVKDSVYDTPEFRAWRALVVGRADGQCQALDPYGHRCIRAAPRYRMYADHIIELKDGGSLLDPNNGQCLCRSHHEIKTIATRKQRLQSVDGSLPNR